jgi:hypothetical protein
MNHRSIIFSLAGLLALSFQAFAQDGEVLFEIILGEGREIIIEGEGEKVVQSVGGGAITEDGTVGLLGNVTDRTRNFALRWRPGGDPIEMPTATIANLLNHRILRVSTLKVSPSRIFVKMEELFSIRVWRR